MTTKTPVAILQEYCQQFKCKHPDYIELPAKFENLEWNFSCSVSLCGKESIGCGKNKKSAKHNAASNLLDILKIKKPTLNQTDCNGNVEPLNHVGSLMELCAQNKWPKPVFKELGGTGPSHMPIFSYQCTLFKITREAKAHTKKDAKNNVAALVLEAAKEIHYEQEKNVEWGEKEITKAFGELVQIHESILKTYLEKRRTLQLPKYKRNDFFSKLDPDLIKKAHRSFLSSSHQTMRDRVLSLLKNLEIENYEIESAPTKGEPLQAFLLEEADLYFVEFKEKFWPKLAEYLSVMLEFKIDFNEFNVQIKL